MSRTLEQIVAALSPEKRKMLADLLSPPREPIAVVGMACRFPGGADSPGEFWSLLRNGVDAVTEVPASRWDANAYYDPDPAAPGRAYTRWGGFLRDIEMFDAGFFGISAAEAVRMDPQQRLLLETAWEALEDAGEAVERLAGSPTGVFVGIVPSQYDIRQRAVEGAGCLNDPHLGIGCSSSVAAGRLSHLFDFRGPNVALDTACSSSLVAVHLACRSLANGECDLALAGGVNAVLVPEVFIQFCKMGMLARDGRTKTFSAAADGFAAGEGCGFVVLRRMSDALAKGNSIAALIRGSAVNEDGRSPTITAPNGDAQAAVIRTALATAGVRPDDVSYIETHGSGTSLGDPIEVEALAAIFGRRSMDDPLCLGAVKTNVGHLAAAAGMAGLIKTVLALRHREIPPNLHCHQPNPRTNWSSLPFILPAQCQAWHPASGRRVAGVSSFGWSGTNAHVVLEEAPPPPANQPRDCNLLVISARSPRALDAAVERTTRHLAEHAPEIADAAFTLALGRSHFEHRTALIVTGDDISRLAPDDFESRREVAFFLPDLSRTDCSAGLALYAAEPAFREAVDRYGGSGPKGPVLQRALAAMWLAWGIRPSAVWGHGAAEPVAAELRAELGVTSHNGASVVLELGPACDRADHGTVAGLPPPGESDSAPQFAARSLARLWQMGVQVDWGAYYNGHKCRRISLPAYPFERQRYWLSAAAARNRLEPQDWFYIPAWKETAPSVGGLSGSMQWLVFADESGVAGRLTACLEQRGQEVILVHAGDAPRRVGAGYVLRAGCRADYDFLLSDLRRRSFRPAHIVHAWTVGPPPAGSDGEVRENELESGFYSLLSLSQALGDYGADRIALTVLSSNLHRLWDSESIVPERAAVLGVSQVAPFEYPALSARSIDIEFPMRVPIEQLADEVLSSGDPVVALRGARRWIRDFERLPRSTREQVSPWRRGGVYLITGAMGGIGMAIAEHLAVTAQARLALLARKLHAGGMERVRALEARGVEVIALEVDISEGVAVRGAIDSILRRFGSIQGVFHAAGVPGHGIIALKTRPAVAAVFASKIYGTLALRTALRGVPLDFFALFSSVASATGGGPGQVDYVAASSFLDACASADPLTVSLSWGEWQWNAWRHAMSGMDADTRRSFEVERQNFGFHFQEGMGALERALASRIPHLYVSSQDLPALVAWARSQSAGNLPYLPENRQEFPRPTLETSYTRPGSPIEEIIAAVWKEHLRLEDIGVDDNFFELGGNSLIGVTLMAKLRARLGIDKLPAHLLFEAPTVASMALLLSGDDRRASRLDERERHGAQRRAMQMRRRGA